MERTITFDTTASRAKHAVALIYDLEGFSRFFNQPDVHDYVPQFLNTVNQALSVQISGGKEFWGSEDELSALTLQPVHYKFLGDGGLYVWVEDDSHKITASFVNSLCNRLWNIKTEFPEIVRTSYDRVPVVDVPKKIRFGIARGTVSNLDRKALGIESTLAFASI